MTRAHAPKQKSHRAKSELFCKRCGHAVVAQPAPR
jgi:rRNA maturation endonuclease Nob1